MPCVASHVTLLGPTCSYWPHPPPGLSCDLVAAFNWCHPSPTQVTQVLRSGPSGALAQLHAVKGRRCEQEHVSHLTEHTAAAL